MVSLSYDVISINSLVKNSAVVLLQTSFLLDEGGVRGWASDTINRVKIYCCAERMLWRNYHVFSNVFPLTILCINPMTTMYPM